MILFALPLLHLSAHLFGFVVRVLEYSPHGCGVALKRVGQFSLTVFAVSSWLVILHSMIWLGLVGTSLLLAALSGYLLELLEEEEMRVPVRRQVSVRRVRSRE